MNENDPAEAARQWRNRVNNAQGHIFEDLIKKGCQFYSGKKIAEIDKTPEPFRVTSKAKQGGIFTGRFTAAAQPDFQGTLAGGRSVCFEAKHTTTGKLRQEALTAEQAQVLERRHNLGALAGVCAGIGDQFFFLPWPVWRDMKIHYGRKYITAEDVEQYRVRFNGAVLFLDDVYN